MAQDECSPALVLTGQRSTGRSSIPCQNDTYNDITARKIVPEDWRGADATSEATASDAEVEDQEEDDLKTTTHDSSDIAKTRLSIMMRLSEHAPSACQRMMMHCSQEELLQEQETVLGSSSSSTIDYQHDDEVAKATVERTNTTTTNREFNNETTVVPCQEVQQKRGGGGGGQVRVVSFGTLHIREFPIAIGDNPSVQFGGPPLRLEYESQHGCVEYILSVDEYEGQRHPRRHKGDLRIPLAMRREWVGYDPVVERQVAAEQILRNYSIATAEWDEWHYRWECTMRGITKRFQRQQQQIGGFFFGNKKQQDDFGATNSAWLAEQWCRQYKQEHQKLQKSTNNRHTQNDRVVIPWTFTYSINMPPPGLFK